MTSPLTQSSRPWQLAQHLFTNAQLYDVSAKKPSQRDCNNQDPMTQLTTHLESNVHPTRATMCGGHAQCKSKQHFTQNTCDVHNNAVMTLGSCNLNCCKPFPVKAISRWSAAMRWS